MSCGEFEDEDDGKGPVHFAAELGLTPFRDLPGPRAACSPAAVLPPRDRGVDALARVGSRMLTEHEQMRWGCRVVAEDPEGRATEVNQRLHGRPRLRRRNQPTSCHAAGQDDRRRWYASAPCSRPRPG